MPIPTGTRIGPYEIVGWLGAGGMGEVYRARDPRLGREVAIKLIPETFATDASRVHRFEQEARAAGQLNHPNILAVYDVGIHAGAPYIVSELLEGESLRSRLRRRRAAVAQSRRLRAPDRGGARRRARQGHRPPRREARQPVHHQRRADQDPRLRHRQADAAERRRGPAHRLPTETAAGMVVGTAGYMSPEQVRGEAVDARSDIFSFGTVLYEMLTGRPAFARETAAETMAAILKEDPPEPLPATVPPALARIVSRCLEKTREARFQSARDLAFGSRSLSETSADRGPASPSWRRGAGVRRRWRRRRRAEPLDGRRELADSGQQRRRRLMIPLANATFTRFTNWEGTEEGAEISPDGKFVAFLADRDGEFDLWLSQVGTGRLSQSHAGLPAAGRQRVHRAETRLFGRRLGDLVQSRGRQAADDHAPDGRHAAAVPARRHQHARLVSRRHPPRLRRQSQPRRSDVSRRSHRRRRAPDPRARAAEEHESGLVAWTTSGSTSPADRSRRTRRKWTCGAFDPRADRRSE